MGKIIENGLNIKENGQEVTFRVVFPSLIQTVIKQKTLYPISLKPDTRPCIFFFERMMKNHIFALKQH